MVGICVRGAERTVETYERALNAFGPTPLTKAGLSAWVVTLRQRGLSVTTVNIMTRAVSSYLVVAARGGTPSRALTDQAATESAEANQGVLGC